MLRLQTRVCYIDAPEPEPQSESKSESESHQPVLSLSHTELFNPLMAPSVPVDPVKFRPQVYLIGLALNGKLYIKINDQQFLGGKPWIPAKPIMKLQDIINLLHYYHIYHHYIYYTSKLVLHF